uniref:Uncharacterized protein n=1 Tax=Rhizophora mucronata TaxID=61149 RepID=A0A2P2KGY6_RHIMU
MCCFSCYYFTLGLYPKLGSFFVCCFFFFFVFFTVGVWMLITLLIIKETMRAY